MRSCGGNCGHLCSHKPKDDNKQIVSQEAKLFTKRYETKNWQRSL